jgi:hypothetical protein
MIETSATFLSEGSVGGFLHLNHTGVIDFASVLIAKFVSVFGSFGTNSAIRTLGLRPRSNLTSGAVQR